MRKVWCTSIAFLLIFFNVYAVPAPTASAAASNKIVLSTDFDSYKVQDMVRVSVYAENTVNLFGVQFTLEYPAEALQFGDIVTNDFSNMASKVSEGSVTYALTGKSSNGITAESVHIADIQLKVTSPQTASLLLTGVKVVDTRSNEVQYNTNDEKIITLLKGDGGNPDPVDVTKPVVEITSKTSVNTADYTLTGTVSDNDPNVTLTVNGNAVAVNPNGEFSYKATLTEGENKFDISAKDTAGNIGAPNPNPFIVTYKKDSSNPNPTNPTNPNPGVPSKPDEKEHMAQEKITAAAGGTVQLGDKAKVSVPAGALRNDATISIEQLTDESLIDSLLPHPSSLVLVSDIYQFSSSDSSELQGQIKITLQYFKDKVRSGQFMGLYYFHDERQQWIYIGGSADAQRNEISADVNHFGTFAVFVDTDLVPLTDISSHWAEKYIDRLIGMRVVNGYPDRTFKPEKNITRAEFTVMITGALGLKAGNDAKLDFADADQVPTWADQAVKAAVEAGIIHGKAVSGGKTIFDPHALITRAEMSVMIANALGGNPPGQALSFKDADQIPAWAKSSVQAAVNHSIITGFEDNSFRPQNKATRAQAATMICKLLDYLRI